MAAGFVAKVKNIFRRSQPTETKGPGIEPPPGKSEGTKSALLQKIEREEPQRRQELESRAVEQIVTSGFPQPKREKPPPEDTVDVMLQREGAVKEALQQTRSEEGGKGKPSGVETTKRTKIGRLEETHRATMPEAWRKPATTETKTPTLVGAPGGETKEY